MTMDGVIVFRARGDALGTRWFSTVREMMIFEEGGRDGVTRDSVEYSAHYVTLDELVSFLRGQAS